MLCGWQCDEVKDKDMELGAESNKSKMENADNESSDGSLSDSDTESNTGTILPSYLLVYFLFYIRNRTNTTSTVID